MKSRFFLLVLAACLPLCLRAQDGEQDRIQELVNRGHALYQQFSFPEAMDCYEAAFQMDESNEQLASLIVSCLFEQNKFDEALRYVEKLGLSQNVEMQKWAETVKNTIQAYKELGQVTIDPKEMEESVLSDPGAYVALLERFQQGDLTLTKGEVLKLYFGAPFAEYATDDQSVWFIEREIKEGNLKDAFSIGKNILLETPFAMRLLQMICQLGEELEEDTTVYYNQLTMLYQTLLLTGNGFSPETATAVTCITDQEAFLKMIGYTETSLAETIEGPQGQYIHKVGFITSQGPKIRYFNYDNLPEVDAEPVG